MTAARQKVLLPLASIGLFVSAYEHLTLYRRDYRFIPIIGVLFALNVATSTLTGVVLLVRKDLLSRLAGLAVALGTLFFFAATRLLPAGIFNFTEKGLQPSPQAAITLLAESVTSVLITSTLFPRKVGRSGLPLPAFSPDAPRR
jgi:hypothetical protein